MYIGPNLVKTEKYANYLTSWDFPNVFDQVYDEMKVQKKSLEKKNIDRHASKDLDEYIKKIKKRCERSLENPEKNLSIPRDANRT